MAAEMSAVMNIPPPWEIYLVSYVLPLLAVLGFAYLIWRMLRNPREGKWVLTSIPILIFYQILSTYFQYIIQTWLLQSSYIIEEVPYYSEVMAVAMNSSLFWYFAGWASTIASWVTVGSFLFYAVYRLRNISMGTLGEIRSYFRRNHTRQVTALTKISTDR